MERVITIQTPDGRLQTLPAPEGAPTLTDWLASQHLPLNTRCGGRGICRGCFVEVDGEEVRACQCSLELLSRVNIPEAALRDRRLNGISAFEIGSRNHRFHRRPGLGLALDIGTTTVAAALWDLATGECRAHGSAANEQRRHGDNVLSRIDHAVGTAGGVSNLQTALVRDSLEPLIRNLLSRAGLDSAEPDTAVAAGNTVMLHSLAGARLDGFAAYPFRPIFLDTLTLDGAALGFSSPFPIRLSPGLGAFVGGDIALGAVAAGLLESEGPALLIDFGTNGEILLKTREGFLATATAAGPAFEGGRLRCGSIAGPGVISSIDRMEGEWRVRFAEGDPGARPTGISGAAYLDVLCLARREGMLGRMGRFDPDHPGVRVRNTGEGEERYVTIHQGQTVSEPDVAELLQAKAAIAAGVMTLLEQAELEPRDLRTVYIAGGFGYHLNRLHAMEVGLIPTVDPERIRVIGNASLGGASLWLQTDDDAAIESLRARCRVIELNQVESFEDHFIDCMALDGIS